VDEGKVGILQLPLYIISIGAFALIEPLIEMFKVEWAGVVRLSSRSQVSGKVDSRCWQQNAL